MLTEEDKQKSHGLCLLDPPGVPPNLPAAVWNSFGRRGTATGGGTTRDTNQRLALAWQSFEWESSAEHNGAAADTAPFLDAAIVGERASERARASERRRFFFPSLFCAINRAKISKSPRINPSLSPPPLVFHCVETFFLWCCIFCFYFFVFFCFFFFVLPGQRVEHAR